MKKSRKKANKKPISATEISFQKSILLEKFQKGENQMKKTNILRFFCALLGIVTLLSSVPVWAEEGTTDVPFDFTVNFDKAGSEILTGINGTAVSANTIGDKLYDYTSGNISGDYNTDDAKVFTSLDYDTGNYVFYIRKDPKNSANYTLRIENACYFAVQDVNQKLPKSDFIVSGDFYFPSSQAESENGSNLIRWTRGSTLNNNGGSPTYSLVGLNADEKLVANGKELDIAIPFDKWFNVSTHIDYVIDDVYRIKLYLDGVLISTYFMNMPAPSTSIASYILTFDRPNGYKQARLDNLHIYETTFEAETPDENAPLDVYMDFEYGKKIGSHLNGTITDTTTASGLHQGNISPYVYNPDIEIRTHYDYTDPGNRGMYIQTDPNDSTNYVLKVMSTNSYFAVKDKFKKLAGADFTVSAKIYLDLSYASFTGTLPLIQWVRDGELALNEVTGVTNRYTFISAKNDGTLVVNSEDLDTTLTTATWYDIKVVAERIIEDTYTISLYLGDEFLTSYEFDMPAPDDGDEGSYVLFFTRGGTGCKGSCIDDIRITEHSNDKFDVTLDFNSLTAGKIVQGTDYKEEWLNIGELLNTDKFAITFPMDNGGGSFAYKTIASGEDIYLEIVSGNSYVAIEDLGKRLEKSDFAASADMYLNFDLSKFTSGELSLLQWSKGEKLNSNNYNLISVDNHGQLIANGNGLGVFVDLNAWFNISAHVNYLTDDSYEVAIYLDGNLICVYELDMPSGDREFIRFLGTGTGGFMGSRIDNIRITQAELGTPSFADNIWTADFNGYENGTVMNADNWSAASSAYPVVCVGGENQIEDGRLKITSTSTSTATELSIGGKGYESILAYGSAAISMKFELSQAGATDVSHSLISWKKLTDEASILGFKNNKFVFCGITLPDEIVIGNEYDVKVVIDGYRKLAELYIGGDKKVSSALILGVDTDISATDRITETISMFASSANDASVAYYVDDLKIEKLDRASNFDVSFDFTGWSGYSSLPLSEKVIGFKTGTSNLPTIAKTENGNEYLCGNGGVKRFFINDINGELRYNNFVLEFDLYYTDGNEETTFSNVIDFRSGLNSDSGGGLLLADGLGNLKISSTVIAKEISGQLTKIRIEFITDDTNTKWNKVKVSVNGGEEMEIVSEKSFSAQMCFRFIPQKKASFGWDNIRLYTIENATETTDFTLDFNGDYETALDSVGSAYYYPAIGSTRTGADDNTYTSAEVLSKQVTVGDEVENRKFLRIDRTYLDKAQDGYFHVDKANFIGLDEYIVEADFGITSAQGFGITPVTIVGKNGAKKFTPVDVVGYYNTLQVSIRGAIYKLYSSDGTLLKVKTAEDNGFTKLAVLINETDSTYTVYVDERIAYYYYDGEYLPCAELPIHYKNTGTYTGTTGYLRVMETPSVNNNAAIIDIARVAVIPSPSGINTSFVAVQSKVEDSENFAVRFIAGIDALYGNAVGFKVTTTYTKNGTPVTTEKILSTPTVYSSVTVVSQNVTANELGSNYLFMMSVTELPNSVGDVNFEIVPFVEHGNKPCYGEKVDITAQYADNNVTFTVK